MDGEGEDEEEPACREDRRRGSLPLPLLQRKETGEDYTALGLYGLLGQAHQTGLGSQMRSG